jgi:hypothetical protein
MAPQLHTLTYSCRSCSYSLALCLMERIESTHDGVDIRSNTGQLSCVLMSKNVEKLVARLKYVMQQRLKQRHAFRKFP